MKKVKDSIARLLYQLILAFVKITPGRSGSKHLLIIKLDEIGDYMLFRNYLPLIRSAEQYDGFKITFLGNAAWREIFERYDASYADDVIWVSKKKFNKSLAYRFQLFREVRSLRLSHLVDCVFSRSLIVDDGFSWVATAPVKIAMNEDLVNLNRGKFATSLNKVIYNKILFSGEVPVFDGIKNTRFLSQLLGRSVSPKLKLEISDPPLVGTEKYYTFFISAGNMKERQWPIQHFIELARYIRSKTDMKLVLCGVASEATEAQDIVDALGADGTINFVGKTTLLQYANIVNYSAFLFSVDTGPVHIAAATGCRVVALYSGVHYGRYGPYPSEYGKTFYSIYPDLIEQYIRDNDPTLYNSFKLKNEYIRQISVEKVVPYIDKMLEDSGN